MANKILTKKSSTASVVPTAADLDVGELAVNTADGKLYTKHTDDSIVEVVGSGGTGGTTNLTAGVIWDNHSTTAYEYTNDGSATLSSGITATDITVVADKTAVLTHDADTEELRSVYIEKYVIPPPAVPESQTPMFTSSGASGYTVIEDTYLAGYFEGENALATLLDVPIANYQMLNWTASVWHFEYAYQGNDITDPPVGYIIIHADDPSGFKVGGDFIFGSEGPGTGTGYPALRK